MGGHAYRRQNKKERVAALAERTQRGRRKSAKVAATPDSAGKAKKTR